MPHTSATHLIAIVTVESLTSEAHKYSSIP